MRFCYCNFGEKSPYRGRGYPPSRTLPPLSRFAPSPRTPITPPLQSWKQIGTYASPPPSSLPARRIWNLKVWCVPPPPPPIRPKKLNLDLIKALCVGLSSHGYAVRDRPRFRMCTPSKRDVWVVCTSLVAWEGLTNARTHAHVFSFFFGGGLF